MYNSKRVFLHHLEDIYKLLSSLRFLLSYKKLLDMKNSYGFSYLLPKSGSRSSKRMAFFCVYYKLIINFFTKDIKICYNNSMNDKNYEDFISTVSHELRTPLTSIRGFSQTMLASWDKLDDDSKKKFLKIIEEQSNRLINLVENMLSVTKLQSARDTIILKEINIKPVIETIVWIVKSQYNSRNFKIDINPNTSPILVDKDKFQQIMTNLVENAAKYSDENSTITVTTNSCNNCEFVSIKVTDKGLGIKEEDYDKIFNKFSRIDNPLTRKVQGSGLGLYITKNLVEKMGGKISVSSKDNLTTFEILLPSANIERQARVKCSQ